MFRSRQELARGRGLLDRREHQVHACGPEASANGAGVFWFA